MDDNFHPKLLHRLKKERESMSTKQQRPATPREYLPSDIYEWYPRFEGETKEEFQERVVISAASRVESDKKGATIEVASWGDDKAKFNEGDVNSKERGTCARSNAGKVAFSLVPFHLLTGCARILMWGSKKYAPWNWAKGGQWSTPMDCLLRHLFKWWFCGEEVDKESGEHHLDHAMCNLLFLIHYNKTHLDGDNRPDPSLTFFDTTIDDLEQ